MFPLHRISSGNWGLRFAWVAHGGHGGWGEPHPVDAHGWAGGEGGRGNGAGVWGYGHCSTLTGAIKGVRVMRGLREGFR